MKKKNLQLKLNLKKQTVLDLSAQNTIHGGKPDTSVLSNACQATVANCATQVMPCCPGCRSGFNATLVKEMCDVVLQSVDAAERAACQ